MTDLTDYARLAADYARHLATDTTKTARYREQWAEIADKLQAWMDNPDTAPDA